MSIFKVYVVVVNVVFIIVPEMYTVKTPALVVSSVIAPSTLYLAIFDGFFFYLSSKTPMSTVSHPLAIVWKKARFG